MTEPGTGPPQPHTAPTTPEPRQGLGPVQVEGRGCRREGDVTVGGTQGTLQVPPGASLAVQG